MIRIIYCSVLLLCCTLLTPLAAQDKPKVPPQKAQVAPTVHIVIPSADGFVEDLEYLIKMTSKPKQITVLKEYFDEVFLIGVDFAQPLRLDILLDDDNKYRKRLYLPVTKKDLKTFRDDNLGGYDYTTRKVRKTKYLYKVKDPGGLQIGWLRWRDEYAILGEKQGDVSLKLPKPLVAIQALLEKKFDIAIEGKNAPVDIKANVIKRHQQFQGTRKELLAALKINETKKETKEDFVLRKMVFTQQLDELERIYAEVEHLLIGWTTDSKKQKGALNLTLKPLAGTSLETSLKLLGTKPSYFANILKTKEAILSGRINFAIDEMRKKHMLETNAILRKRNKAKVGLDKKATAEQKTNQQKAWDLYFDMIDAGVKAGVIDGFVEVHPSAKKTQTMIGGIHSADGTALVPLLELFGKIHPDTKPKLNTITVGDVKIHEIQIVKARHPGFSDLFGTETLLLGTSKNVIWYAAGENALKELKAAIALAAKKEKKKEVVVEKKKEAKKTFAPLLDVQIKLLPWIKLLDQKRITQADETKEKSKVRKFALIAFAGGKDELSFKLNRVDNQIEGKMDVMPNVLRFVGEMIADFSKENLAE